MQMCVASVLGVMQILVGLVNIGLGPGRTHVRPGDVAALWAAYWLGAVFVVSGVFTIVSGTCRAPCLTGFGTVLNLLGALFSITGLVLYSLDLSHVSVVWMCDRRADSDPCRHVAAIAQRALSWMDISLLVLMLLQLCVNISAAVLSFMSRTDKVQAPCSADLHALL
ncbi:hypothetical protein WMY93_026331 [Mugilogobius chulae]|uniref:Uncharacterized protein n=1 Tax=Mugilogobius chulae TaxID=88201 RepID=A0AAW0N1H0_9GOBI